MVRIGVLSYQGAVSEHIDSVRRLGMEAVKIRDARALEGVDGLILPGGESTTHGKLLVKYGLDEAIRERASRGMPVFGTCTGIILLAREIVGSDQPRLGLMDIAVERNAFGRQVDSFEADIEVDGLGDLFPAVFIRAPVVRRVGPRVKVLARWQGDPVMVREGQFLGCAFHPELTEDTRIHEYFLGMVEEAHSHRAGK
ncbi:MAG: pyridoxal 5'-phosphate synthase glutaminase subunit PdxT [Firmicutes bacterium]|jgi:5'-phosphate synthase pdxT subunit|nr:pyridoxal 5'-phosphate synthase glutaminase subunit PdxT [Bacillota bacterium]